MQEAKMNKTCKQDINDFTDASNLSTQDAESFRCS
jgi:hypothetical protein